MSDYETIQRRRNILVGLFVMVALGALGVMIYKFGEVPSAVSKWGSYQVKVQFPTAPGVQRDTPVRFCGYQIGRVTNVRPPQVMQDLNSRLWYHQTLVILSIDKAFSNIPKDVEAKLMTRGLGSSYVELKLKHFDVNEPTGPFLTNNDFLQGSTGMTSEFFPEESQKKLQELVDGLRTLTDNVNKIVGDPENQKHIQELLANLAVDSKLAGPTLTNATTALEKATQTMEQFRQLAATGDESIKKANVNIEKLVTSVVETSEQLAKAMAQFRLVLQKVNEGKGSTGLIFNDPKFYENLLENTNQLDALLKELNAFVIQAREKGLPLKLK